MISEESSLVILNQTGHYLGLLGCNEARVCLSEELVPFLICAERKVMNFIAENHL